MSAAAGTTMVKRASHPGVLVVAAFAAFILTGGFLLSLPISHRQGVESIGIGDSMFTAVSAVTVTGLTVVDTSAEWSRFGELVLVVMMQVGGLGIMTLAGFVGLVVSRRMGVRAGLLAGAEIGVADLGVLRRLVRSIVIFVVVTEVVVAALLTIRFALESENTLRHSLHLGLFHSISAFNNAGFSNLAGGLGRYIDDWYLNLVLAGAFILGGIGFPVVFELRRRWRTPGSWSLHTKVSLAVTAGLLAGGTVLILLIEWTNRATIGNESVATKVLASFFQSATARTAGFDTFAPTAMRNATLLLLILLMVIGASSASTGGGIKTSTLAVVVKATISELRHDKSVTMFDRTVRPLVQGEALSLVVAALGTVGTASFVMALIEPDIDPIQLLFESASAFGTVGLSTGITEGLAPLGKLVLIVLMFVGRVGPITFGTAVLLRRDAKKYGYAEEDLIVG